MKQLKFLYGIIISISLLSTNIFCEDMMSQEEMDLAKLTEELMGSMTPEQRAEVDQELARFMALPEDQQGAYLEDKFKELSVDLEKAEALQKMEQPQEEPQEEIEVKVETQKTKPFIRAELTKVEQVQNALKRIIQHIEPLILKTKALPRVSTNVKKENEWLALTETLIELNSFAKIISPKENLIDLLASVEFLLLRNQLTDIANYLEEHESNIVVPDAAGLTINYDEEDEDESTNVVLIAQKKLDKAIPTLKSLVEDEQVIWGLKRLLQKYAPEELKKVEVEKKAEKKFIADFKPGKETPSTATPKYNDPFFPYYSGGSGYNPSSTTSSDRPGLSGSSSDKGKGGKGSADAKAMTDKGDKGDKKDKTGKDKEGKDKDGKDKKDKNKKPAAPDLKTLNELQKTLENISKIAKDNKILDLIKDEETEDAQESEEVYGPDGEVLTDTGAFGPKTEEQTKKEEEAQKPLKINSRDFIAPFIQININYDKASKLATKFNSSIKSMPDDTKKLFQMQIKGLFEDPELKLKKIDKAFEIIKDAVDKLTKRSAADANADKLTPDQELQKEVYAALKHNKELKELLGIKKAKTEKDKKPDLDNAAQQAG